MFVCKVRGFGGAPEKSGPCIGGINPFSGSKTPIQDPSPPSTNPRTRDGPLTKTGLRTSRTNHSCPFDLGFSFARVPCIGHFGLLPL